MRVHVCVRISAERSHVSGESVLFSINFFFYQSFPLIELLEDLSREHTVSALNCRICLENSLALFLLVYVYIFAKLSLLIFFFRARDVIYHENNASTCQSKFF